MWIIAVVLIVAAVIDIITGFSTALGVCFAALLAFAGFSAFVIAALQDIAAINRARSNADIKINNMRGK